MFAIVGILLAILLMSMSFFVSTIKWPFDQIKIFANKYPLKTARFVIGAITSCLLAYLFDATLIVEITYAGAIGSVILGELV